MKKIIIFLLIMMNLTSVCAVNETPRYKIIGSSYQQEDIDEMYKIKDQLLLNYKKWVKGVDDVYQVLADHQDDLGTVRRNPQESTYFREVVRLLPRRLQGYPV